MDVVGASKFIKQQVEQLEKSVFMFDEVIKPRADADKVMLKRLRDQQIKLDSLITKIKAGEQPTLSEYSECVPQAFRSNISQ